MEEDKQQQDVPGMGVQVIKAMAESVAIPGVSDDALKEVRFIKIFPKGKNTPYKNVLIVEIFRIRCD